MAEQNSYQPVPQDEVPRGRRSCCCSPARATPVLPLLSAAVPQSSLGGPIENRTGDAPSTNEVGGGGVGASQSTRGVPPQLNSNEVPICRICLEADGYEDFGSLISPCKCSGTAAYVHRKCLDAWRAECVTRNPDILTACNECQFPYKLSHDATKPLPTNRRTMMTFTTYFARSLLRVFCLVQPLLFYVASMVYLLDTFNTRQGALCGNINLCGKQFFRQNWLWKLPDPAVDPVYVESIMKRGDEALWKLDFGLKSPFWTSTAEIFSSEWQELTTNPDVALCYYSWAAILLIFLMEVFMINLNVRAFMVSHFLCCPYWTQRCSGGFYRWAVVRATGSETTANTGLQQIAELNLEQQRAEEGFWTFLADYFSGGTGSSNTDDAVAGPSVVGPPVNWDDGNRLIGKASDDLAIIFIPKRVHHNS